MNSLIKCLMIIAMLTCSLANADEGMENLKFFKSNNMQQHGKWQLELLEGGDPQMQQGMQKMGKMSICTDIAKQMTKDHWHDSTRANSCTHKVVRDSAETLEIEMSCDSGSHTHSVTTRDGDKSYLIVADISSKDSKARHMKARYTYQGECTGEGVVQLDVDKDSKACQMMRKNNKGVDNMTAMCARLQGDMREQCEKQIKSMAAACQ